MKKHKYLYLNLLLTAIIFIIFLMINKIYPFGTLNLAISDAIYQYSPMLYNFITKIQNNLLESYYFNLFLGMPSSFTFVYYLASPLNLIALIFKSPEAMYASVVILKMLVTSMFAYIYFSKKTDKKISILLANCYVFSGWFLAYYYNIMWLDAFMILPLLELGLENVLKNKPIIYILSLTYIMYANFYCAYYLCIFILIYYLINIFTLKESYHYKIKNFLMILFSTILVFLLSYYQLSSVYEIFLQTKISLTSISNYNLKIPLLSFLESFLSGAKILKVESIGNVFPNISVSLFITMGFIAYFFNKKIKIKTRIKNLIILIFWIICFYSPIINYILAGFTVPSGLPFRYSFIFTFFIIKLFIDNYHHYIINYKNYLINLFLLIITLILYFYNNLNGYIFALNIYMIIIYTLYLILYQKYGSKINKLLFIFIPIELIASLCLNIPGYDNKISYGFNDNTNYRINSNKHANYSLYHNENNLSFFSSMTYIKPLEFMDSLGLQTNMKSILTYKDNTPLFDMLFNIHNPQYNLNKIYGVNNNILNYNYTMKDPFTSQNELITSMTNIKDVLVKTNLNKIIKDDIYTYKANKEDNYYFYLENNCNFIIIGDTIYIETNEKFMLPENYKDLKKETIEYTSLLKAHLKKDDQIIVSYNKAQELEFFTVNKNNLLKVYNYLKTYNINYTYYQDNLIKGNIYLDDNMLIYITIPYDKSWHIYLDDQEVKPLEINSLMAVEASPGSHTLMLEYKKDNTLKIIITSIGLLILIIYIIKARK